MSAADEIGMALQMTLATLRSEFPDALVRDVSLNLCAGERSDHDNPQDWVRLRWRVQVNNACGDGTSLGEALIDLRERIERDERVRKNAVHLAAVLKEIPTDMFEQSMTVDAAQHILENERRLRSK